MDVVERGLASRSGGGRSAKTSSAGGQVAREDSGRVDTSSGGWGAWWLCFHIGCTVLRVNRFTLDGAKGSPQTGAVGGGGVSRRNLLSW